MGSRGMGAATRPAADMDQGNRVVSAVLDNGGDATQVAQDEDYQAGQW